MQIYHVAIFKKNLNLQQWTHLGDWLISLILASLVKMVRTILVLGVEEDWMYDATDVSLLV